MSPQLELKILLETNDAVSLLRSVERRLESLRGVSGEAGSEEWAEGVRERMALFIVKLALEATLAAPARARGA